MMDPSTRKILAQRAAYSVHSSVCDFAMLIDQAESVDEVLRVTAFIVEVIAALQAVENKSLHRADALCG